MADQAVLKYLSIDTTFDPCYLSLDSTFKFKGIVMNLKKCFLCNFRGISYFQIFLDVVQLSYKPSNWLGQFFPMPRVKGLKGNDINVLYIPRILQERKKEQEPTLVTLSL